MDRAIHQLNLCLTDRTAKKIFEALHHISNLYHHKLSSHIQPLNHFRLYYVICMIPTKNIAKKSYFRFSFDVAAAKSVYRTIVQKVFWEVYSTIMQNLSDVLLLFCTPTWPSPHVSENQKLIQWVVTCIACMY